MSWKVINNKKKKSSTWEVIGRWSYILKSKIILGVYAGEYDENLRIITPKKNGIKKAQNNQKKKNKGRKAARKMPFEF